MSSQDQCTAMLGKGRVRTASGALSVLRSAFGGMRSNWRIRDQTYAARGSCMTWRDRNCPTEVSARGSSLREANRRQVQIPSKTGAAATGGGGNLNKGKRGRKAKAICFAFLESKRERTPAAPPRSLLPLLPSAPNFVFSTLSSSCTRIAIFITANHRRLSFSLDCSSLFTHHSPHSSSYLPSDFSLSH